MAGGKKSAIHCPPTKDAERFIDWLHGFGAKQPGCVFYPTSDDVAFLVASHLDSLAPLFRLFSPSHDALLEILDKSRLAAAANRAGLKSPVTLTPRHEHEVQRLAGELALPVLLKPRTQALSRMLGKAVLVNRREEIVQAWRTMRTANAHQPVITGIPDVDLPILQATAAYSTPSS